MIINTLFHIISLQNSVLKKKFFTIVAIHLVFKKFKRLFNHTLDVLLEIIIVLDILEALVDFL